VGIGFMIVLLSCNSNTGNNHTAADSTGTLHPDGVSGGNVISTDTAAMKVPAEETNKGKKE
jgi:hypothetical protein